MKLGLKQATLVLFIVFLILSFYMVLPVGATPCAILKVSLPQGKYVGYNSDPWLSECWLLNLTGVSQTFTLRINNTSSASRSYDTHVIIALNDAGYSNFGTLVVNGTTVVPKSAFRKGTPKPYNLWNWPSGDVYPTWFDDTCVNVGTIPKKRSVDLVISVTFSSATGVSMHFDAYGSRVSSLPPNDGYITHNGISEDSTVLLQPGAPPPQPPIASFFYDPYYPEIHQLVTFNASESYDPDGYIVSYAWNFGDGTPIVVENDPITNHTYTNFGDHTVKLTVTDNSGLTGNATAVIHVTQHPVASFTFSPPDPLIHEIVTFDASSSSPDGGTIISYEWNFGDGNTTVSGPIITHAYATYGTYTVTLNVTDSEGKLDTESKPITVEKAPIADFWWSPYYPQRCEDVSFDASGSTPDGGVIISYAWDFGDGTPIAVEDNPTTTHSYAAVGDYTVTLNVTDSEGRWDTESKTITVVLRRYFLKVKTEPVGIVTIPSEDWYNEGTNVDLTAPEYVPVSTGIRYRFSYWDVNETTKSGNPITVIMDANYTATAHYVLQYYLTVTSPYGTPGGEDWYDKSTKAYATVTPLTVPGTPGIQYVFTHWSGDATGATSPSDPIIMDAPKTAVANWKTQYLLTVLTDPAGLSPQPTRNPAGEAGPANGWWYDYLTDVTLTAQQVTEYTFDHWDVDLTTKQGNPIIVTMDTKHTATAHYIIPPPPLSVSINPLSASIYVGQSVTFTSTVSGGTSPYYYKWYLNGNPVSGATSSSWTFTPSTSGTYSVFLEITDSKGNTVQSSIASIKVGPRPPVGGYSISLTKQTPISYITVYTMLIALFGAVLSFTKRKRK